MLNPVFFWSAVVTAFSLGFTAGILACWWMRQNEERREFERKRAAETE